MKKKIFTIIGIIIISCLAGAGIWVYVEANSGLAVQIYRLNIRTHQLEPEQRRISYSEPEEMVQTVIRMMYDIPRNSSLRQTITEDLLFDKVQVTGSTMDVFFPARYHEMEPHNEAIFRASLVHTMTNLPFISIEGLRIWVDNEELEDPFGEPMGLITQERVLISPNIRPMRVFEQELILYFVNEDRDGLISEERTVDRPDGVSVEYIVITELINGPIHESSTGTISSNTRILDVRTEGGLCSINFSSEFIDQFHWPQAIAELTLQSIVLSLMENNASINNVRFLIESEPRETFNGVPYFDALFERDNLN